MSVATRPAATSLLTRVADASQVGETRRQAALVCRSLGSSEEEAGRAGIVATELAGNLVKHAGGGDVLIHGRPGPSGAIEFLALDRGPGIQDLGRAFTDGHSTAGTPGTGLGAVRRLSSTFDVYSQAGQGTALFASVAIGGAGRAVAHGLSVPKPGEEECGDAWCDWSGDGGLHVVVADGLGHGPLARDAALTALAAGGAARPSRGLEDAHMASRSTRGCAMALVAIAPASGVLHFAGLGNVAAVLLDPAGRSRSLVSMNGIVGQGLLKPREFEYSFEPGTLLILASDGLGTRWNAERYPGLFHRHPALIAGVLYRDHSRGTDDTTVVALRLGAAA